MATGNVRMKQSSELTKQIIKYCLLQGHFVMRINNIPFGAGGFKKNVVKKGVPDIMGCSKSGIALGIETKTTDKQSKEQKDFEDNFTKRGSIYILARKLEDVTERI